MLVRFYIQRYNHHMQRIPEAELMNAPEQALAYAQADFTTPHQHFIQLFSEHFPRFSLNSPVLDLGCGPCDVSRRFARAFPASTIHAVDGAVAMLKQAEQINREQGLSNRIKLFESCLPELELPQIHYHTVISNSLLHHLHNPSVLWQCLQQYAAPSASIFIMDLIRPKTEPLARQLVELYAAREPAILQNDFYQSLCAAFTPDEVKRQLVEHALEKLAVKVISDRHMIIYGTIETTFNPHADKSQP